MSEHIVKIHSTDTVTHDVLEFVVDKPQGFEFTPGQATEVEINKPGWKKEDRPFTFTSLPEDEYLEFTVKIYPERDGVTDKLRDLEVSDEFLIHEPFGAIKYEGEGYFIAGGAGVTPFISILRKLQQENNLGYNKLLFSNKTKADIIRGDEFSKMLGDNFINILSEEKTDKCEYGHFSKEFFKRHVDDFSKKFYVCGPPAMIDDIVAQLNELGADEENIIMEEA